MCHIFNIHSEQDRVGLGMVLAVPHVKMESVVQFCWSAFMERCITHRRKRLKRAGIMYLWKWAFDFPLSLFPCLGIIVQMCNPLVD